MKTMCQFCNVEHESVEAMGTTVVGCPWLGDNEFVMVRPRLSPELADRYERAAVALDVALGRGRDIQVEVAKAITVAQENREVEAKVVCKAAADLVDAMRMMAGKHVHDVGFRWNSREGVHELPNGSAVRICFEKARTSP